MFGISGFELLIILALALIIFGPEKLPQLGRTIGRTMATFKRVQEDMERVIRAEMYASEKADDTSSQVGADVADDAVVAAEPVAAAATIWAATDEDDEEDEEE